MLDITVPEAIKNRFSCRSFLDKPVPEDVLTRLLENALRSPSGANIQASHIHVVTGEKKQQLQAATKQCFLESFTGDGYDFRVYPEKMSAGTKQRRDDCGERLYSTLEIPRDDRAARMVQTSKNAEFFNAPVGLIITVDACAAEAQLIDCGILLQSIMLLAEDEGLNSCPQGFWTMFPNTIRTVLGIKDELVVVGAAIGYQDEDAIVNTVRQPRLALDEAVTFHQ